MLQLCFKGGKMEGILYGVGIGPGDPELLTLKAVRIIKESDIIAVPAKEAASCTAYQIALKAVPQMADKPVLTLPVPMTTDKEKLDASYEEGSLKLQKALEKGKKVALLNLGDPTIYGTCMKFYERIVKAGGNAEIVNGVPSFCAVAGALGIALSAEKEKIHILPGYYCLSDVEAYGDTRILMKSGGRVDEVKTQLVKLEEAGKIKACAVTDCGMESQEICRDIRKLDEKAGYFTTIVIKEQGK